MRASSVARRFAGLTAVGTAAAVALATPALAKGGGTPPKPPHPPSRGASPSATIATSTFAVGQLQAQTVGQPGCGTNGAGEPAIHVSRDNLVVLGSENGLGGGSELWRGTQVGGTTAASPCALTYSGQPNAVGGVGASGGDIDIAIAPTVDPTTGTRRIYVASLNLGSVNVATSTDNGATFTQTPVQAGLPLDDREWIAAAGATTALLTYHDIATNNIDVLRSTDGGRSFVQTTTAIPPTDYKAMNNELGNIVIDHDNPAPGGSFYAYQSFVAPSSLTGSGYNEAFLSVSADGGSSFTVKPIPCSTASPDTDLDHNFPNVSVAPDGTVWYAWSDDHSIYTAHSADHGDSWTCSGPVSTTAQSIFPWLAATSGGVDLVYYGAPTGPGTKQTFSVYFTQNLGSGFTAPQAVTTVHQGEVCEGGVSCTGGRQLFDDFGVDTDQSGWAHIAFSHDSPDLGGSGTYTGYAVQTGGTPVGVPN